MDRSVLLLLQVLCAAALLSGSEAIRCYTCSSDSDPRCADPVDKTMLPEGCTPELVKRVARQLANVLGSAASYGTDAFGERNAQFGVNQFPMGCQKLDLLVTDSLQSQRRKNVTIRGCVLLREDPEEHCRHISENMQSVTLQNTFCGACRAEGCNGASGLAVATLAALAPVLLSLLLAGGRQ